MHSSSSFHVCDAGENTAETERGTAVNYHTAKQEKATETSLPSNLKAK